MQGTLFLQGTDGGMTHIMNMEKLPEFVPPEPSEEDADKVLADFSKPMTFECTCRPCYMSPRSRKWWLCLTRYGNWKAKGPIRMRMLKKAAMQEKSFIRTYHIHRDADGRFWYRRGDGLVVELIVDEDVRRMHDGR